MKIVLISSFRSRCGIGLYTHSLVKNLVNFPQVKEIHLITHTDSDIFLNSPKLKIYKVINEKLPFYLKKLIEITKRVQPNVVDIEWDHNLYSPLPFLGKYIYPYLLLVREKLIISFHSLYHLKDIKKVTKNLGPLNLPFTMYYGVMKKFLIEIPKIGRVFTLYELDQVRKKKNFYLIRHPIDETNPLPLPTFSNKVNLLVFGFIRERKNYELAISSLTKLPKNYNLLIVGKPINPWIIVHIKKLIKKYDVKDRVKIFPFFVSEKEKLNIIKKSHLFLLPYKIISVSGVLQDSIKYARPVVSTVLQKDIDSLGIGEFSLEKPEEFSYKIEKIMEKYKEYYKAILACRAEFFWKNVTPKIINIYSKIIHQ